MKVVAVSPHLDDAAFSAGGALAMLAGQGAEVMVVTCFTGNVARPTGFALACQLDKGLDAEIDYMALRRAEDVVACTALGAASRHLPFLEAPHRGYDSAPALFAARLAGDDMADRLAPALAVQLGDADLVLGPLGIGDHVDHHVVRDALEQVVPADRLLLWEDWPYLDRAERVPADPVLTVALDDAARDARVAACGAYATQLGFQFGGADAMARRIRAIGAERFHKSFPSLERQG